MKPTRKARFKKRSVGGVVFTLVLTTAIAGPVWAADPSALWFFGDSPTDEGRNSRTAPIMWPQIIRSDLGASAGINYAIGGAITSNQPSATFGDTSFLGQVRSFTATTPALGANPVAGVWIGTNNIWQGSAQGLAPTLIVSSAVEDVKSGLTQISGAGVHTTYLLGVYVLSLTNAYDLAGANTPAVRRAAATASQQYNSNYSPSLQT